MASRRQPLPVGSWKRIEPPADPFPADAVVVFVGAVVWLPPNRLLAAAAATAAGWLMSQLTNFSLSVVIEPARAERVLRHRASHEPKVCKYGSNAWRNQSRLVLLGTVKRQSQT